MHAATLITILLADILACSVIVVLQTGLIVKALPFEIMVRKGNLRDAVRSAMAMLADAQERLAIV